MTGFNQIERSRRTAIYIRISTSQQQTDRQETELKEFALRNGLNFNEKTDMYIDIISGFKEGEVRPQAFEPSQVHRVLPVQKRLAMVRQAADVGT